MTKTTVSAVLFEGFELLDVFGPLEILGVLANHFEIVVVGPAAGPVRSNQGPCAMADVAYADAPPSDVVLVPGGKGTRALVDDAAFLRWFAGWSAPSRIVASVCTGSGVLAAAGLLDGYRATSNKQSFAWAKAQGPKVEWVPQARWVEDRDRWTSSGVAAGMDMTLALVAHLAGESTAEAVADGIEFEWHRDPTWDPYAVLCGLVDPS